MATERLLAEIKSGDLPSLNLGNFNWQPIDADKPKFLSRAAAGPVPNGAGGAGAQAGNQQVPIKPNRVENIDAEKALTSASFPLNLLENKTFAGKGYNTIWRGGNDVLELNLTAESTTFTTSLGDVPNRGLGILGVGDDPKLRDGPNDILLKGLGYIQRVGAFEDEDTGKDNKKKPTAIHFEPGCLMLVPPSGTPKQDLTINRMASIPHGTTINAQGLAPKGFQARKPTDKDITSVGITPFNIGRGPESPADFFRDRQTIGTGPVETRLPKILTEFSKQGTIDQKVLDNPNLVLLRAIENQNIESFATFEVTTLPKDNVYSGGGTANIGFLGNNAISGPLMTFDPQTKTFKPDPKSGSPNPSGQENAHAASMTCRYWIEIVTDTLDIKAGQKQPQKLDPRVSKSGILGPTFIIPPTDKLTQDKKIKVKWTQIQYSQNVTLNFNGLSWPHISVATLGDISEITIDVTKDTFGPHTFGGS